MTTDVLGIEREIDLHKKEEKLKISDNDDSNDDDDEFSILPMAQLFEVFHLPQQAHNTNIIHPKSKSPGSPDSAYCFEFSAKRLAENAKIIKFALFAGLYLIFP